MFRLTSFNPNRILFRGILSILFGVAAIAVPGITLEQVIRALGVLLLLEGLFNLITGMVEKAKKQPVYVIVPRGTTNMIVGAALILFPGFLVSIFVFVIGFMLLIAGGSQLISQLSGRSLMGFSWVITFFSLIALLSGVVMLFNPFESAMTILIIFGVVIALYGTGEIIWSFRVRKYLKEHPPEQPKTVDVEYEEV